MKTCTSCTETKSHEHFYPDARYADGFRGPCKRCISAQSAAWHRENRERTNAGERARRARATLEERALRREKDRVFRLRNSYGLSVEQFDALLASQGGRCAIPACGAGEPGSKGTWHVDHDHRCCPGKKSCGRCVRGLLCATCNVGIGMLKDSPEVLISAAEYLKRPALMQMLGAQTG